MTQFFHPYGVIVGLAIVVGLLLVEYRTKLFLGAKWSSKVEQSFWLLGGIVLVSGVIGARVWHVATDWYLYQDSLFDIFKIWNGGLSILGAIVGGAVGLFWWFRFTKETSIPWQAWLDLAVFGLPFAQAIGRFANYLNQELYGLPTHVPWGIEIEGTRYHPLWAYEALLMLLFGGGIWLIDRRESVWGTTLRIGRGYYFIAYLMYYSFIRFWLDFWRLDKAMSGVPGLGINQLVLLSIMSLSGIWLLRRYLWHIQKESLGKG